MLLIGALTFWIVLPHTDFNDFLWQICVQNRCCHPHDGRFILSDDDLRHDRIILRFHSSLGIVHPWAPLPGVGHLLLGLWQLGSFLATDAVLLRLPLMFGTHQHSSIMATRRDNYRDLPRPVSSTLMCSLPLTFLAPTPGPCESSTPSHATGPPPVPHMLLD